MTDAMPIRRALLSVSDKTGLVELATALAGRGWSCSRPAARRGRCATAGLAVRDVADITGFPEMMDGRVKTLHPTVHGGLLALRDNAEHLAAMETHGIAPIDLLVVNLYPFEATVASGAGDDEMHREHRHRRPGDDPRGGQEPWRCRRGRRPARTTPALLDEMRDARAGPPGSRSGRRLAQTAYARTAAYDAAVSTWMAGAQGIAAPRRRALRRHARRRPCAMARTRTSRPPSTSTARSAPAWRRRRSIQGKELSYNNINDTDAAFELVAEFAPRTARPAPSSSTPTRAASPAARPWPRPSARALRLRPDLGLRRHRRAERAARRADGRSDRAIFTEVVIAPDADDAAKAIFAAKKNLRLLTTGGLPDPRGARHGLQAGRGRLPGPGRATTAAIVGRRPEGRDPPRADRGRTGRPSASPGRVAKHVKSNAIVYAKGGATVGIGAGQMSRVDSTRIAARKAEDMAEELGLAEDADNGLGRGLGRLLPLSRRPSDGGRGRGDGGDPARRVDARRRGDRGRRRGRARHGLHRHAAFPALTGRTGFFISPR